LLKQKQEGEERVRGGLRVVEKLMLQIEVSSHGKWKSKRRNRDVNVGKYK